MIESNDGGATVSVDGGKTWIDAGLRDGAVLSRDHDDAFPVSHLRRAAGQLDAVRAEQRAAWTYRDWLEAGGGESGWIAPRHDDPDIVYAGSYGNLLTRKDHAHRASR